MTFRRDVKVIELAGKGLRITRDPWGAGVFVQTASGEISSFESGISQKFPGIFSEFSGRLAPMGSLPSPSHRFSITKRENTHVIGLDNKGHLFLDSKTLATDCTSYVIHDKHLLYTTSGNILKFIPFAKPGEQILVLFFIDKFFR